jgi:hypothetical protein
MMLLSYAHAEMTALPKVDTKCTAPSLIPTVNGNTVRSFSTHGHQSKAKGSSTTVSRDNIRLIQHLDSSASWFGPEVALNWLFPYPLLPSQPAPLAVRAAAEGATAAVTRRNAEFRIQRIASPVPAAGFSQRMRAREGGRGAMGAMEKGGGRKRILLGFRKRLVEDSRVGGG